MKAVVLWSAGGKFQLQLSNIKGLAGYPGWMSHGIQGRDLARPRERATNRGPLGCGFISLSLPPYPHLSVFLRCLIFLSGTWPALGAGIRLLPSWSVSIPSVIHSGQRKGWLVVQDICHLGKDHRGRASLAEQTRFCSGLDRFAHSWASPCPVEQTGFCSGLDMFAHSWASPCPVEQTGFCSGLDMFAHSWASPCPVEKPHEERGPLHLSPPDSDCQRLGCQPAVPACDST
uniref:Unnaemd protein product n=1 Tax=Macaca fascicularis TaxID=9541 RepID=Q9N074_MACFA|nr:unnaemd protein product [Macaca fascicularis]